MNIKKLPDKMDPNIMIRECVHAKYGLICPFCSEVKQVKTFDNLNQFLILSDGKYSWMGEDIKSGITRSTVYRYGKPKSHNLIEWFKNLFKRREKWIKYLYMCHTCGAIWESSEFPDEIKVTLNKESPLSKIDRDEWTVTHSDDDLYISRM